MDLQIIVDPRAALKDLAHTREDQIPFALAKAINATAIDVQKAEFAHQSRLFTLRRPEWVKRSNKITKFAKKKDPVAIIGIHPPGGDQRADIIGKFETERQKLPRGRTIAIPVGARIKRTNAGIISKRDRPGAYNFRQIGKRIIGDRGTFIIRRSNGTGLLLQRRRKQVFALYLLIPRARLTPNLAFEKTAFQTVERTFATNMVREFNKAMASAR